MDSIKVTFGLEQIFQEQKLSVDQAAVQEEVESAKKESPEMFEQPDFDVEKLIAQVEDELKVGPHPLLFLHLPHALRFATFLLLLLLLSINLLGV